MGQQGKQVFAGIALVAGAIAILLIVPLRVGVWLPDMINAPRKVLAEERSNSGESVRVIQYWNRCDFYNTHLEYVQTNGTLMTYILDGDDLKSWRVPLAVDWQNKTAKVTLGSGLNRTVDLRTGDWQ